VIDAAGGCCGTVSLNQIRKNRHTQTA
jgi:hypothetical protein